MEKKFELTENDQNKISYLITNFARTEPNVLKYSEVIFLMLDRCMFNTKFTLSHFHDLFQAASKVKTNRPSDKTQLQGERVMYKEQLIFLFHQAAKLLYKPDPNYLQKFYNTFVEETTQSQNGEINRSRVMVVDQISKKLIVEEVMIKLKEYSEEIKHIFIAYAIENYRSIKKHKRLLLSFRQIVLQNKRWNYDSQSCPHLITVQHVQEVMRMIIPNINSKQQQFYSKRVLSEGYHKDVENHDDSSHPGDPGIMLFEMQLLIIRIALDSYPKDQEKKEIKPIIDRYFKYLNLRSDDQLTAVELPNLNKKLILKMKQYYAVIQGNALHQTHIQQAEELSLTPFEVLAKKMQKEVDQAPDLQLDFHQIFKSLDKDLPKLPPLPKVQPEYVGPYDKNFVITIGQQPPPEISEKDQKVKAEKKDAGKKDQIPARQFKWASVPETKLSGEDYMKGIETKLHFEVKPLGDITRGTINKQGYPTIITEILFPPELPKSVVPFIQAAANALTDRNFISAIENYKSGAIAWKKTTVEYDSVAELFFEYSKGNVYLSAGKYDYALQIFNNCRKYSDTSRLPFTNPDRSLPYFGLGEVFYEMEEYEISARAFLKARQIRESVLGLEHVQTASVFNNLSCCFFMLRRSQQALGYIQIAQVVIDTELGSHHERTMTCRSNLKKISRGTFENQPQLRKFWEVFEEDKFEKKKKKKKDDAPKKK